MNVANKLLRDQQRQKYENAFEGMTLLDYAINAALVISNTALMKQDKAG